MRRRRTPTAILLDKLDDLGFTVKTFLPARGYWRRVDVARWEADVIRRADEVPVTLYCWEPICLCARRDLEISDDPALSDLQYLYVAVKDKRRE